MNKATSARFLMTVAFSLTTCYGFVKGLISAEAFMVITTYIVKSYYDRKDRKGEKNEKVDS